MSTDFSPRNIVCLVDLSKASGPVLSWAAFLARLYNARVELFHALWEGAVKEQGEERAGVDLQMRETELYGQLDDLAARDFGADVEYKIAIEPGHPVATVLEHLVAHVPDLVIFGSHGYDGAIRTMLGSVAENVVRAADSPMLIVKGGEADAGAHLRRIVCPVNFTDLARQCMETAASIAARARCELLLLGVSEEPQFDEPAMRERLTGWVPPQVRSAARTIEVVYHGDPAEQIIAFLRDNPAELVVLGAEHRPFFEFTTLGRTTERVVRYSPCSTLVLPHKL